jgi:hypothetical protein
VKNRILGFILLIGLLFSVAPTGLAAVYHRRTRYTAAQARRARHRRNMRTAKRIGIGAAGGAAIGALAGGGKGAAIGAAVGAGGGALYDRQKRKHGR